MTSAASVGGNGDNALLYSCNVRARTRARARVEKLIEATVDAVAGAKTVAGHHVSDPLARFPCMVAGLLADAMHVLGRLAPEAGRYEGQRLWAETNGLRDWLIDAFAARHGWRRSRAWFTPGMLAKGGVQYNPWRNEPDWSGEFIDHSFCFRSSDGRAAAFATNPYGLGWKEDDPAIRAFCERHRLRVRIPDDFPSWWYPGRTTLIVFTAAT